MKQTLFEPILNGLPAFLFHPYLTHQIILRGFDILINGLDFDSSKLSLHYWPMSYVRVNLTFLLLSKVFFSLDCFIIVLDGYYNLTSVVE